VKLPDFASYPVKTGVFREFEKSLKKGSLLHDLYPLFAVYCCTME